MRLLRKRSHRKPVSLALQGGGAHGAFIWGVLDRLLEEDRLVIEGISGTSSGAINAALIVDGIEEGGPPGAREKLARFWRRISETCEGRRRPRFALPRPGRGSHLDLSTGTVFYQIMHRVLLPYDFDASTMDPLRSAIADVIDFEHVRKTEKVKLFVNATDVCANKMRVFENPEIDLDVICASSCLPFLFKPVEIDGAHYWDGGFMGNPALYPLIYECRSRDIMLLQTSPFGAPEPPRSAAEILERISEISFSSTLVRELRTIAHLNELVEAGGVKRRAGLKRINMHVIEAGAEMEQFPATSKFHAEWEFFQALRRIGRRAADEWLARNLEKIGVESTVDIHERFL